MGDKQCCTDQELLKKRLFPTTKSPFLVLTPSKRVLVSGEFSRKSYYLAAVYCLVGKGNCCMAEKVTGQKEIYFQAFRKVYLKTLIRYHLKSEGVVLQHCFKIGTTTPEVFPEISEGVHGYHSIELYFV